MDEKAREAIYKALEMLSRDPHMALMRKRRADASLAYALEHTEEWRALYPDHWIAVYDCKLIAADPIQEQLLDKAKLAGVPISESYLKFLSKDAYLQML